MVDRLEQAGLVRRERDDNDRRKVFIATVPENIARVGRFYEHMQQAMLKLWETYSDAELRLLLRFADARLRDDAGGDRGAEGDDGGAGGQTRRR